MSENDYPEKLTIKNIYRYDREMRKAQDWPGLGQPADNSSNLTWSIKFTFPPCARDVWKYGGEVIEKSREGDFDFGDGDLLDLLGSFKCYKSPTKDNIFALLHELAHQEIVQKPRYIVDCRAPIVNSMKVYTPFQTMEDLKTFYDAKKPSSKKSISLLSASPEPGAEQSSFEHFKRFVKSLNGNDLGSLLQFLTGT